MMHGIAAHRCDDTHGGDRLIRCATDVDAEAMAHIYNHYVMQTIVTFEEAAIDGAEMASRLMEVAAAGLPWLVQEVNDRVVGYAYASKWKGRCGYRFSVETTIYLDPSSIGQGHGRALYTELLSRLKAGSTHSAIGGIALPNEGSVALHERMGFEKVAHFREVGTKFGKWIDVGYWQLKF